MRSYIAMKEGSLGFGESKEAAEEDLYINICRQSIQSDTKGEFLKRRQVLKPWLPLENMLHISGIGCLVYENGILRDEKSGRSINITDVNYSTFYYLCSVFQGMLSFTDIAIVLRPEIDIFFRNIDKRFHSLNDFPQIKLLNSLNGFEPTVTYMLDFGILVGVADNMLGIKEQGHELFFTVDMEKDCSIQAMLSYLGLKLGYLFTEKEARQV